MSDGEGDTFLGRVLKEQRQRARDEARDERIDVRMPSMLAATIGSEANRAGIPRNDLIVAVLRAAFTGER